MAQRRMFSLDVVDTDLFLDMPASTQNLYFHLGMRADDDGFISSPRKITSMVSCSADDLKILTSKGFVIPFKSGVCVIRDWKINNHIQKDRYHETKYFQEKHMLFMQENRSYQIMDTECIQTGSNMDTEARLVKSSQDKVAIIGSKENDFICRFRVPSVQEVGEYCKERENSVDPNVFIDYYTSCGWKVGNKRMKDWRAAIRTWERQQNSLQQKELPPPRPNVETFEVDGKLYVKEVST